MARTRTKTKENPGEVMQVPLQAQVNNRDGVTRVDLWRNGEKITVTPPVRPYFYSKYDLGDYPNIHVWKETKKVLSTLEEEDLYGYELNSTSEYFDLKSEHQTILEQTPTAWAEARCPYLMKVIIDDPDYFKQYAQTEDVKVLHIDIEQDHEEGVFPDENDMIVSVALGKNGEKPYATMVETLDREQEIDMLEEVAHYIKDFDPDIIVGYNHLSYDIPMLIARMQHYGINIGGVFSRTGEFVIEDGEVKQCDGRIYFDLLHSVLKDQTLHGIKNRKLKTVAKWFKLDVIEVEHDNIKDLIGTYELRKYNESDVKITQALFETYFPKVLTMAEYLGAPLSELIPFADSYPGTVLQARILKKRGIVSDGSNKEREPFVFQNKFEAAYVDIFRKGLYSPVYHYDFASLYPHIMWSMGIGPDNTRIIRVDPKTEFSVSERGNTRIYSIPDENHNCNFVIEVIGDSEVAKFIQEMLETRLKLKAKAKESDDPVERAKLESQQYALKVVLNSVYGLNGAAHLHYGSVAVAIMIVGIGRQLAKHLTDICEDSRIEYDTDGIYVNKEYDPQDLTDQINMFTSIAMKGLPVFTIEGDKYDAGYYHQMKNYVLLKGDKLVRHGVAFKGSQLPGIFDKVIETVAPVMLKEGSRVGLKVARLMTDLSKYNPDEFAQSVKMGKELEEYASQNAVAVQVALDAEKKYGIPPTKGMQYHYVKTNRGYEYYDANSFSRLDTRYYRGVIYTALQRLGYSKNRVQNVSLKEFF